MNRCSHNTQDPLNLRIHCHLSQGLDLTPIQTHQGGGFIFLLSSSWNYVYLCSQEIEWT